MNISCLESYQTTRAPYTTQPNKYSAHDEKSAAKHIPTTSHPVRYSASKSSKIFNSRNLYMKLGLEIRTVNHQ